MKRLSKYSSMLEYAKQYNKAASLRKEAPDIVLPPYISTAFVTNSNWAKDYLKVDQYATTRPVMRRKAVVFVIDTAGRIDHPDVAPLVHNKYGRDFTGEGVADGNGHGTACASCYIGKVNGVSPKDSVVVVPLKALKNNGSGSYGNVLSSLKYAYDTWKTFFKGTHLGVVSMSLGGGGSYSPISKQMEEMKKAGMWIAASSGNSGFSDTTNRVGFPAKDPSAWAMGAIDSRGNIASFSSAGKEVVFAGPGRAVQVAWKDNKYINANGTSFGMPYATAALLWMGCQYPQLDSMEKAEKYFQEYVTDHYKPGKDVGTGHGVPILAPFIGKKPDAEPGPTPPPTPPPTTPAPPPPPEEPEAPQTRPRARTLPIPLENNSWYVVWSQQRKKGSHKLKVDKVVLEYKTKAHAVEANDKVEKAVNEFFRNQGFVLAITRDNMTAADMANAFKVSEKRRKSPYLTFFTQGYDKDYNDAAWTTAKFIEVILKIKNDITITVKELHAQDEKGRKTIYFNN